MEDIGFRWREGQLPWSFLRHMKSIKDKCRKALQLLYIISNKDLGGDWTTLLNEWMFFRPPLCISRLKWTRRTSWGWQSYWGYTAIIHFGSCVWSGQLTLLRIPITHQIQTGLWLHCIWVGKTIVLGGTRSIANVLDDAQGHIEHRPSKIFRWRPASLLYRSWACDTKWNWKLIWTTQPTHML